jgi:hypothetical protein
MNRLLSALNGLAYPPKGDASDWLSSAEDGVAFLKQNAMAPTTVLYASTGDVLIHTVLAPRAGSRNLNRAISGVSA